MLEMMLKSEQMIELDHFQCARNVETFSCRSCGYWTLFQHVLNNHECGQTKTYRRYFCEDCNDFLSHSLLVMLKHAAEKCKVETIPLSLIVPRIMQCPYCDHYYKARSCLKRHIVMKHNSNSKKSNVKVHCPYCKKSLKTKSYLNKHIQIKHASEKPKQIKCDQCPFQSFFVCNLKTHVLKIHQGVEPKRSDRGYNCEQCSYATLLRFQLRRHVLVEHTASDRSKTKPLIGHIRNRHTDPKDITWLRCDQCSYICKGKGHLTRHVKLKHGIDNKDAVFFSCDQCSFKSKWKNSVKKHIKEMHTDSKDIQWFHCSHCSYKGKSKRALTSHTRHRHTDHNDIKWFYCDECSYKSKTNPPLNRHIRIRHSDPRDIEWFHCKFCPFKSKSKHDLKEHLNRRHIKL